MLHIGGSPYWCVLNGIPKGARLTCPWTASKPPESGIETPSLTLHQFARPVEAGYWLRDLAVSEQYACTSAQGMDIYCKDGCVTIGNSGDTPVRVTLVDAYNITCANALHLALTNAISRAGGLALHASAFRYGDRGIVALGGPGAGKSTLAAAAAVTGGSIVSDDSIVVHTPPGGAAVAYPLRRDLSLRRESLQMLNARNRAGAVTHHNGKELKWFFPRDGAAIAYADATVIDEIWILQTPSAAPTPSKTPMPAAMALMNVMQSNPYLAMPFEQERRRTTEAGLTLVNTARHFLVDLTTRLLTDPGAVLRELVEKN